jgi:hypothetical protein
LALNQSKNEN